MTVCTNIRVCYVTFIKKNAFYKETKIIKSKIKTMKIDTENRYKIDMFR